MATFRKRGEKWQAQVRRKKQPTVSRSFTHKVDADGWARDMERAADREELGTLIKGAAEDLTVGELLRRYCAEVIALKRGRDVETYIVNAMLRQDFCNIAISDVSPAPITKYRDQRLKTVQDVTVRRELNILQHAFDVAAQEWDWPIKENPVRSIRKPSSGNARDRRLLPGEFTGEKVDWGGWAAAVTKQQIISFMDEHYSEDRKPWKGCRFSPPAPASAGRRSEGRIISTHLPG